MGMSLPVEVGTAQCSCGKLISSLVHWFIGAWVVTFKENARRSRFTPRHPLVGVGFPNPFRGTKILDKIGIGRGNLAPTRWWLHIYRKVIFQMKITVTILMFLALFLPATPAQDYTRWNLPEGAVARLGKGSVQEILYSPDGARLAVRGSIGIWLYDTISYREVALLARHTEEVTGVVFSPDGKMIASWKSGDYTVRLWDAVTGQPSGTLPGDKGVGSVVFSPDGKTLAWGWPKPVRLWVLSMAAPLSSGLAGDGFSGWTSRRA